MVEALSHGPNSTALLVPKGSPITSIAQLRGKSIAVAQGSSSDYHLLTVLEKAHLSVKEVTIEHLQPAEALAAFTSGQVDAWDIWDPYSSEAIVEDGAKVLVNGQGYGSNYSFEVASQAALADPGKKAAIKAYLALLNQAYRWEQSHSAQWAQSWSAATGVPLKVMQIATKDEASVPGPISPAVVSSEQRLADAFYGAGLLPSRVNFQSFSYTGYNDLFNKQ